MKDITSGPASDTEKQPGAPPKKKQFIVIEIPAQEGDHSYPKAIFACDTVDEALKLCKQMNVDAGYERYGVQGPAASQKRHK